MQIKLTI